MDCYAPNDLRTTPNTNEQLSLLAIILKQKMLEKYSVNSSDA